MFSKFGTILPAIQVNIFYFWNTLLLLSFFSVYLFLPVLYRQGETRRCRLSWLTNSALVYEPKYRGRGERGEGELWGLSQWVHYSPNKLWRCNSIFNLCLERRGAGADYSGVCAGSRLREENQRKEPACRTYEPCFFLSQCIGSGSAWIHIDFALLDSDPMGNADPDPGSQKYRVPNTNKPDFQPFKLAFVPT